MSKKFHLRLVLFLSLAFPLLAVAALVPMAHAEASILPPRPTAALPPRPLPAPTPTPTPTPPPVEPGHPVAPDMAYIELQVQPAVTGLWTVVQWQDAWGDWHDVAGWQGTLEDGGRKVWWVAPKDFATGPFRWVVSQVSDGPVLGTSVPFNLPAGAGQGLKVEITLTAQ